MGVKSFWAIIIYVYDVFLILSSSNLLGFEFDDKKKKAKDVTAGYLDYNTTIWYLLCMLIYN